MRVSAKLVWLAWLVAFSGAAQTVRFAGSVRTGETYRHPIGRGLILVVTTDGIAVRPASGSTADNYAACETPPAHGPNPLDIEGWHFDPAQKDASPGMRREFQFALTRESDRMECALARALYQQDEVPGYRAQRLGWGVVTLAEVVLNDPKDEVVSFQFAAVVTLPRLRKR